MRCSSVTLKPAVLFLLGISVFMATAGPTAAQLPKDYELVVMPPNFEFTLAPGDTLEDSIFITEAGGQSVDIEVTSNSNWLFLPFFFTCPLTPTTIPFWITSSGLPPGVYYDTITVTIYLNCETYHSHVTVPVQLNITESGDTLLASSPTSFSFVLQPGDSLVREPLHIYDVEGYTCNFWTYNSSYWLYVDTMEASPLYTPEDIYIDIYAGGLPPGAYSDTVFVYASEAANSPLKIPVDLTIESDTGEYIVATAPEYFYYDIMPGDVRMDSLFVYEIYGRNVPFTFSNNAPWLTVYDPLPEPPYVTPKSLMLMVDTDSLPLGTYSDTILIEPVAGGDSISFPEVRVPVDINVYSQAFEVVALPDHVEISIYQGDTTPNLGIVVYEQSGASLPFWAETLPGSDWLHIQYPDTLAPFWYTPDSLYFDIFAGGLAPGVYADTIVIYDPLDTIAWDDVKIPVILTVLGGETALATIPTYYNFSLNYGDSLFGESLYVYEVHGQSINFWAFNKTSWLEIDTMSSVPLYTPELIYVNIRTAMLTPGFYADTIFVISSAADNSPLAVPVYLTVLGGGTALRADPDYFDITLNVGDTIDLSMLVYDPQGGQVPFYPVVTLGSEWLHLRDAGTIHLTPDSLDFYIIAEGLEPGVYVDTIAYFDSTYKGDFPWPTPLAPVVLTVQGEPPDYVVETMPPALSFNAAPGDIVYDSLYVYEKYGRNVLITFFGGQPWLTIYDPSPMPPYSTPEFLIVSADASSLEPGTYTDTIVIAPEYEVFDTVRVPVTFTVGDQPPDYVILTEPVSFHWTLPPDGFLYDSLYVYEQFGRTGDFFYANFSFWMVVNPLGMPPFTFPTTLPLIVTADSLPPGTYLDSIMIYPAFDSTRFDPVVVPAVLTVTDFMCGDADGNGRLNLLDITMMIRYLYRSTSEINIPEIGDVDGNGILNLLDIVYFIDYLYRNGPAPDCAW